MMGASRAVCGGGCGRDRGLRSATSLAYSGLTELRCVVEDTRRIGAMQHSRKVDRKAKKSELEL
jgi:hypothetical protein